MYRFRSTDSLLDKYNELANQEIYFAPPNELNDPMEGFRDIFWTGDSIVWKNLLKHYLRCLEHVFALSILLNEEKKINSDDIPIQINSIGFPTINYKNMVTEIYNLFFKIDFLNNLPEELSKRENVIRRGELLSYLKLIHPIAIETIAETYRNHHILPNVQTPQKGIDELKTIFEKHGSLIQLTNKLEKENFNIRNAAEKLFSNSIMISKEIELINKCNYSEKELSSNKFFILSEFPEEFVSKLESLIYPNWYSASFMFECTNSSVWGHYANNHQGVCLIFTTKKIDDKILLDLETEYGYSSSGAIVGMVEHNFQKIDYKNKHVEIDFFRSLGRLPIIELESQWYSDEEGNKSICGEHLRKNHDEWHKKYWNNFLKSICIKLDDWEYENEYRLIINENLIDYRDKNKRKLKYNFKDLEGIIFGIKTKNADKVRIIKIIEEKCKKQNRKSFDFYQAYYSQDTGKIEKFKLNLLKFEN
jgi:hypothetical protein